MKKLLIAAILVASQQAIAEDAFCAGLLDSFTEAQMLESMCEVKGVIAEQAVNGLLSHGCLFTFRIAENAMESHRQFFAEKLKTQSLKEFCSSNYVKEIVGIVK